nr:MAG TPA: hypothetical protein [Caudoviricetes sp.]
MERSDSGDGRRGGAVPGLLQAAEMDTGMVAVQRLHVGDGQDAGLPRQMPAVCNAPCPHLGW